MEQTVEPCNLCFTPDGPIRKGDRRPKRMQGLCDHCYYRCYKRMVRLGLASLAESIDLDTGPQKKQATTPPGYAVREVIYGATRLFWGEDS